MEIEKRVKKNDKDIINLKFSVKNNKDRVETLEKFIVPELKRISNKIDKIRTPWIQYLRLLAIGGLLAFFVIVIFFG